MILNQKKQTEDIPFLQSLFLKTFRGIGSDRFWAGYPRAFGPFMGREMGPFLLSRRGRFLKVCTTPRRFTSWTGGIIG